MRFAGNGARHIAEEIDGRVADLIDGDVSAERRVVLVPREHESESANAGGGERLDRSGGDSINANILFAEVSGEVSHARLESGLSDTHHVIVGDGFLCAVVREGDNRAALFHKRLGCLSDGDKGEARDVHGVGEILG